jgi:hypothetical protein
MEIQHNRNPHGQSVSPSQSLSIPIVALLRFSNGMIEVRGPVLARKSTTRTPGSLGYDKWFNGLIHPFIVFSTSACAATTIAVHCKSSRAIIMTGDI